MQTNPARRDYVKALHLKQVGLALAGLWIILLVAAVSATIYREIDGPTVKSALAETRNLTTMNSTLNRDLVSIQNANDDAKRTINQLEDDLRDTRSDRTALQLRLGSYLTILP